jgi:hypothetical protein
MSPVDFLQWREWRGQPIRSTHSVGPEGAETRLIAPGTNGFESRPSGSESGELRSSVPVQELGGGLSALFVRSSLGDWKFESISLQRRVCKPSVPLGEWSTSRKNISLEKARAGRSRCVENRGFASRRVSQPMSGREIRLVVRVQMLSSSLIMKRLLWLSFTCFDRGSMISGVVAPSCTKLKRMPRTPSPSSVSARYRRWWCSC